MSRRRAGDCAARARSDMTAKRTPADEFLDWSKQRLEEIKAALAGLGDQADSLNADARQQADRAIARIRAARADFEAKMSAFLPDLASAKPSARTPSPTSRRIGRTPEPRCESFSPARPAKRPPCERRSLASPNRSAAANRPGRRRRSTALRRRRRAFPAWCAPTTRPIGSAAFSTPFTTIRRWRR